MTNGQRNITTLLAVVAFAVMAAPQAAPNVIAIDWGLGGGRTQLLRLWSDGMMERNSVLSLEDDDWTGWVPVPDPIPPTFNAV